jgi:glyoxylase-like metal-dependent hydrolase (beta-lactamase superfamily II)
VAAPWHIETDRVRVRKLTVGPYENNVYVVACASTGRGVIVDAAAEADKIVSQCRDVNIDAIVTTHGHFDHVGAARDVADQLGVPFRLNEADAEIAGMTIDEPLMPGELAVGDVRLDLRHTPGHTPGSTCLVFEGIVLSGDTLFPGGPGATRFPYSSFDDIMTSLERELFTLANETIVMPGHGLDTTIGSERPALPEWRRRGW